MNSTDNGAAGNSQRQLEAIYNNTSVALFVTDERHLCTYMNPAAERLTGFTLAEAQGRALHDVMHHTRPDGRPYPREECPIDRALPETNRQQGEEVLVHKDGRFYPVAYTASPIRDASGVVGAIVEVRDITREKRAEEALREQARTLETINRINTSLAAELDLDRLVQAVTDAGTELTGAQFGAFFYNVLDAQGEAYMLYTLSGVPREAFAKFPMPRNTAVFGPTFRGEGVVRSDDITKDPRYGKNAPRRGMPRGHLPVRSYLAVPVVSRSGEVLGGLFFGHEKTGVFTEQAERIVSGIAVQAAIAIDNARLYQSAQREVAERTRADEAQQRLAAIVESSDDAILSKDLNGIITSWNRGAERLFGYAAEETIGKPVMMLIPPERQDEEPGILDRLRRGQHIDHYETVRQRKDGSLVEISLTVSPIRNAEGRVVGASKIARDITERRRAEEALRESEERYRITLASIGDAVIATDAAGCVTFMNAVAQALTGWTFAEAAGHPLSEIFHIVNEQTRAPVANPVEKVFREGAIVGLANHTVLIQRGGGEMPIADSGAPIRNVAGETVGAVLVFRDVMEQRQAERQQEMLIEELNHRVKNTLSIVRSMTASTFRNATSTEAFQEAFEGRLHALASAHTLLTRSNWRGAGLRELVEEELAAYQPAREKDLRVSGPDLVLTPAAALALGMVLHELATNAAKYGSLSRPGGQVAVAWDIAGDSGPGQLRLHWAESGGPRVEPPVRRGFGSTVIERSLAYQLGGTVELAFRPEGVHCRIELPLTDTIAKLPSADPERPTA